MPAAADDVALARIWLMGPGDSCSTCRMATECRDRRTCLHLAASAGNPTVASENWSGVDGDFRRFPLGARKVGQVAASGEGTLIKNTPVDATWLARPEWAQREGIC